MRLLLVVTAFLFFSTLLSAQPIIVANDRIEGLDADCSFFLRPTFEVESSNCGAGDSVLLRVEVDTWSDGQIDYVYAYDVSHTRWVIDAARSLAEGLPSETQWINVKVLKDSTSFHQYIPEDLGGPDSQHKLQLIAVDQCGDTSRLTQVYEVRDLTAPTPYEVSLATFLFQDPDGRGPIPASLEVIASDYNLASYDNCSPQDELIYLLDGVLPVIDTTIELEDSLIHVGLDVAHYFDADGFVSLDIPSFDVCDSWDNVTYNSLIEYYTADIYRWDPVERTSSSLRIYDSTKHMDEISFVVADESLNLSDTAIVLVSPSHGIPCPLPSPYNSYLGGLLGKVAALGDDCGVDIVVDYDPTIFCPEVIDTVVAALTIVDADRNDSLFYASNDISPDFEDWTTDAALAGQLGFDSAVRFKYVPELIEGQAADQLTELLSSLPVVGVVSFDLRYELVSSRGHAATYHQRHSVLDTTPPELVVRDVVVVDPDSNRLVEVAAKDLLRESLDNCDYTDLLIYSFADVEPAFVRTPYIACSQLSAIDHLYRSEDTQYIIISDSIDLQPAVLQAYQDGMWHRWSPATRSAYRYVTFDQDCSPVGVTVQARDSNGNQSTASTILQCSEVTSTSDHVDLLGVYIYPNPATERLYIDWKQGTHGRLRLALSSIDGTAIQVEYTDEMSQNQEFDISGLTPGLYILQITSPEGVTHTEKIIIH